MLVTHPHFEQQNFSEFPSHSEGSFVPGKGKEEPHLRSFLTFPTKSTAAGTR